MALAHSVEGGRMKWLCTSVGVLAISFSSLAATNDFEVREGGIIRGPENKKQMALEFTADHFTDGGKIILDELAKRGVKASFFFTGNFFTNSSNRKLAQRLVKEGHYLGPHSDKHLLYCPWEGPKKTLVTKAQFRADLENNLKKIEKLGVKRAEIKYWIPPYEHYNEEIVSWSRELALTLVNFTPGTRSSADYTVDDAKNFVPSKTIYESILKKEQEDPNGLNGFLLLMHFGVGPKRTDKFYNHLGALLDELHKRGYKFVRVDELLKN
jgi:peptidoglycan/xylan/chitin deacetylase (PgdA/CDA1 family)